MRSGGLNRGSDAALNPLQPRDSAAPKRGLGDRMDGVAGDDRLHLEQTDSPDRPFVVGRLEEKSEIARGRALGLDRVSGNHGSGGVFLKTDPPRTMPGGVDNPPF